MRLRSFLISPLVVRVCAGLLLIALALFYLHVLSLAANPQVSTIYRMFYFDRILSTWPDDGLSDLPPTPMDLRTNADPRIGAGFEPGGREDGLWTIDNDAYLILPVPGNDSATYRLELDVSRVFLSGVHDSQPVILFVNGDKMAEWELDTPDAVTLTASIPEEKIGKDRLAVVHLDLPHAHSPAQAGTGQDGRPLSLFISAVRVIPGQPA